MSLILDRIQARLNEFLARERYYERRRIAQTPVQSYVRPHPHMVEKPKEKPAALFGSGQGFGLEYVSYGNPQPRRAPDQRIEVENIQGHVNGEPLMPPQKAYQDPNISRSFDRTSESTDQKPTQKRVSMGEVWDGQVRNAKISSNSPLALRGQRHPTPGDQHALEEDKNYEFDFRG